MGHWERSQQAELEALNVARVERCDGVARRAQHPKHHGCVAARFHVQSDLPEDLRVGLFAKGGTYEALVRFSNGRAADDRDADAHGMAIKVLGASDKGEVQDFVLVDSETFFTGDPAAYMLVNRAVLARSRLTRWLSWLRLLFRPRLLLRLRAFVGKRPSSPLAISYFSSVPYGLGGRFVKYAAFPRQTLEGAPTGPDGLAEALARALEAREAWFDFALDIQRDPVSQPLDDPTVNWRAGGAERAMVASIEIPAQRVEPAASLAENLSFSPWHALAEHRPAGTMNEARRAVYDATVLRRHQLNQVEPVVSSGAPASYGHRPLPREERA